MGDQAESLLSAPLRTVAKLFNRFQSDPNRITRDNGDDQETRTPAAVASAVETGVGLASPPPEPAPQPGRWKPQVGTGARRSPRLLVAAPIRVTGSDARGVIFTEETATVNINLRGARISLIHSLLPDDTVLIKNLENGIEEEFRVVGGFDQVIGGRREWGLEAVSPKSEIWGDRFARAAEQFEPQALIECAACHTKAYSPVSSMEYQVLLSVGMIARHCDRCGETTRWKPSLQRSADGQAVAANRPAAPTIENRRERRLRLTVRLRVRNATGLAELAESRDVSKGGLCFASSQHYEVGEELYIAFLSSNHRAPYETKGKIAWAAREPRNWVYGVSYLK